jgi:glycerol-3-phosphate dehydrogenase
VLYDLLARENNMLPRHAMLGRRRALAQRPGLNPAIVGTATYYDAQLDYAERLCLEVIMDAEQAHPGAAALNYVALHSAHGGTVTLRDECTGTLFDVRPQVVINATGAWIDFANRALGRDTALIGGTKGSHIVVNHPELHALCQGQMFHFVTPDGRLAIFYPLGDRVLIGTTDLPIADPDDAVCDEDETAYLLGLASRVFPEVRVTHDQIVFHFSGVRPLPRSTALVTGQISRDHSFPLAPPTPDIHFPVYSLVGGKWTTFRAFSEQVADAVLATLDRQRQAFTTHMAIGGGRDFPSDDAAREAWVSASAGETGLPADRVRALFSRYGTYAARVAAFMAAGADQTVPHASGYSARELQFLALHEHVVHLDDLILRRTMIGMLGQLSTPLLEALARLTAEALGWDDVRTADETNRARALLWSRHGVRV